MADVWTYIAYAVIAMVANFSYGLTSFGSAILLQVFWHMGEVADIEGLGDITDAVSAIFVISLFVGPVQFWHLRELVNWPLAMYMLALQLLCTVAGIELLFALESSWLKVALGATFMAVAIWKMVEQWRMYRDLIPELTLMVLGRGGDGDADGDEEDDGDEGEDEDEDDGEDGDGERLLHVPPPRWELSTLEHKLVAGFFAGLSGFMSGLFGTKGPPLMVFVAYSGIDVHEWRASSAAMTAMLTPFQVCYTILYKGDFETEDLGGYGVMVGFAFVGLVMGNRLAHRMNAMVVSNIILFLLVLGSALLMTSFSETGTRFMIGAIIALCVVAAAVTVLVLGYRAYRKWRRRVARAEFEGMSKDWEAAQGRSGSSSYGSA